MFKCHTNFDYLERWNRYVQRDRPDSKEGIRDSLKRVKTVLNREKNPPEVSKEEGWSPWLAKDFMNEFELKTRDYHQGFEGDWFAGSNMKQIGSGWPQNNIAYYVEGTA